MKWLSVAFGLIYLGVTAYCAYRWWHASIGDSWLWLAAEFVFFERMVNEMKSAFP